MGCVIWVVSNFKTVVIELMTAAEFFGSCEFLMNSAFGEDSESSQEWL